MVKMRALLCFALLLGLAASLDCPPQYSLMEGRCIRVLALYNGDNTHAIIIDDEMPGYRAECGKDNAHLPIIKNDEENNIFDKIMGSLQDVNSEPILLMDLVCNTLTHRLEWVDGTPASYSWKNTVNFNFDCVATKKTAISNPEFDRWALIETNVANYYLNVLCDYDGPPATTVKPTSPMTSPTTTTIRTSTSTHPTSPTTPRVTSSPVDAQCSDYSLIDISTDGQPCIKVNTSPLSWNNARMACAAGFGSLLTINSAEENKYFWRTALSNGILDGMHIGAHLSNNSQWTWEDGEVAIDGKSYDNFAPFFPIPGAGDCASMATENSAAFWVNENCDNNEQPFICRRSDFSSIPTCCPAVAPKAGDDIFPPGFPNSDIPCEYYLFVSPGKQVELEVLTLIADDKKDFLEILEGSSGPHLIANLTGTVLSTKYTSVESNVLRVNWKPNGSGSGRGFRIRYNEVVA